MANLGKENQQFCPPINSSVKGPREISIKKIGGWKTVAPHLSVVTCGRLKIIREFTPICANQRQQGQKSPRN